MEVFDRITEELKSVYLKDFTYDNFLVQVENIEYQVNLQEKYNLKKFASFMQAPVSQATEGSVK